jgi:hypothetical protein
MRCRAASTAGKKIRSPSLGTVRTVDSQRVQKLRSVRFDYS